MQVAQVIGGYTLGGADLLRRAMGKKLKQEMVRHRAIFVAGAAKNNVSEKVANEIFDLMAKFAGYGFNKSHAVAYSYVAYQTAWLKAHHTAAFMAANMCLILTDSAKIRSFIEDLKLWNIRVLPPDVNESEWFFTAPDEKTVRYGLGGIKGVGEGIIRSLMAERDENGPYKDLFNLCSRLKRRDPNGLSRRLLEGLVKSGALDSLDPDRGKLFGNIDQALKAANDMMEYAGQASLFGDADEPEEIVNWIEVTPWSEHEKLLLEKEVIGFCLTGHLFDECRAEIRRFIPDTIAKVMSSGKSALPKGQGGYRSKNTVKLAGVVLDIRQIIGKRGRMGVVTLDDGSAAIEAVCYSDAWEQYRSVFVKDEIAVIQGRTRWDEKSESVSLSIDSAMNMPRFRAGHNASLLIEVKGKTDLDAIAAIFDAAPPVPNEAAPVVFEVETGKARGQIATEKSVEAAQSVLDAVSHVKGVTHAGFDYP